MFYSKFEIVESLKAIASSDVVGESSKLTVIEPPSDPDAPMSSNGRKFPFIVSLEGNIGAGKSTILEKLQQKYALPYEESKKYFGGIALEKIVFMPEPVDIWTSICDSETGESILEKFYKDPKTYSFAFQVMVYNTHLEAFRRVVKENPDCVLLICERSIDAGRHIFAQMLRDDGMIDDVSFQVYTKLFDSTAGEFPLDAILHLDVEPEVCLKRIAKRARDGEGGIPLEYLEKCDRYYKKWFYPVAEDSEVSLSFSA
jgi:deoxyadenosine/deoxycytidine kinase